MEISKEKGSVGEIGAFESRLWGVVQQACACAETGVVGCCEAYVALQT